MKTRVWANSPPIYKDAQGLQYEGPSNNTLSCPGTVLPYVCRSQCMCLSVCVCGVVDVHLPGLEPVCIMDLVPGSAHMTLIFPSLVHLHKHWRFHAEVSLCQVGNISYGCTHSSSPSVSRRGCRSSIFPLVPMVWVSTISIHSPGYLCP